MELEKFCGILPTANATPKILAKTGLAFTESIEGFVAPTLQPQSDFGDVANARVIVVSAPGAVGKSTLAREIASRQNLPLWDLAQSGPVGQNTLVGTLSVAFGVGVFAGFLADLQSGKQCVVIDALDEARVKITAQAFNAFLEDIAQVSKAASGCSFVLLGRTQIAETAWLELSVLGASPALVSIEPFSSEQADEYIERKVVARGGAAAEALRVHRKPFEDARGMLVDLMRQAVAGDRSTESFLGYAPVLDAMAVRLSESQNFEATRQELMKLVGDAALTPQAQSRPAALLRRVCDDILRREQKHKLVQNVQKQLEPIASKHGWVDWDSLYSPAEQCSRLAAKLLDAKYVGSEKLPVDLRAEYEQRLVTFLDEHPFLRDGKTAANAVFEAYLFTRALFYEEGDLRKAVEKRFVSGNGPSTRLVSDFYFLFMKEAGADIIPLAHISPIYRSLASAESPTTHVSMILEGDDEESDDAGGVFAEGEFVVCVHSGDEVLPASYEFSAPVGKGSVLPLTGRVAETFIYVPGEVRLSAAENEFEAGPAVEIYCEKLAFDVTGLVVVGEKRTGHVAESVDPTVTFVASECEAPRLGRVTARGNLRVSWPGSKSYPWTEFHVEDAVPSELRADPRVLEAFLRFKRIVLTLRSHSKGSLARYYRKVEHQRVLKGAVGQELLRRLVKDGVLRRVADFYHWSPEAASSCVGTSWQELKRGEASVQLKEYLSRFVKDNSAAF
ncbi:hypothetical protein [Corallococcus exercitus]|uniref:hypothetical protein n=1 Tax=Corallococcus exercitus TaxID=2316736 RepID=UPI0011C41C6F|nr:hypothetical protein [Corallococcus exercitus]